MKHEQGVTVLIAETHASCHNRTEDKKHNGMLIYDKGDFDNDVEEELMFCLVVSPYATNSRWGWVHGIAGLRRQQECHDDRPHIRK